MRSPFSPAGRHTGFSWVGFCWSEHSSRDPTRERRRLNPGKLPNMSTQWIVLRAAVDRETSGAVDSL